MPKLCVDLLKKMKMKIRKNYSTKKQRSTMSFSSNHETIQIVSQQKVQAESSRV